MANGKNYGTGGNFRGGGLPEKTGARYISAYEKFAEWKKSRNTDSFDEDIFMEYFLECAKTYKASSLVSLYSMLKTTMIYNHNVDIGNYTRLLAFLKDKQANFDVTQANVFSLAELRKFLIKAPDSVYLGIKTVTVFGIYGVCRIDEITNVKLDMVTDSGTKIILRIPDSKTKTTKVCSIVGEFAEIVRRYIKLRPLGVKTDRFFIKYREGKCIGQNIGKNTFGQMPKKIAQFLQLPNPDGYTGRSFRRTATTLVESGNNRTIGDTFANGISLLSTSTTAGVSSGMNSVNCDLSIKQEDEGFHTEYNALNDPYDDINCNTEYETSQVFTMDSNSEDNQFRNQKNQRIEIEFVNFMDASIKKNVDADPQSLSLYQSKVKDQAEEIVRLKQLTEKQKVEIEILKDLLQKSMKRNLRDEILSENTINSNVRNLDEYVSHMSPAPKIVRIIRRKKRHVTLSS